MRWFGFSIHVCQATKQLESSCPPDLGDQAPLRVGLEHDVAPAQVAVQDGPLVQVVQGLTNLIEEAARLYMCDRGSVNGCMYVC